jgi:hypothetical protein
VAISSESKVFGALVLLVGAAVVGVVAYDIYLHPPGPEQVGVATIVISGEGRFNGEVGTVANLYTIEATSPATVKVPYSLADYVVADIEQDLVILSKPADAGKEKTWLRNSYPTSCGKR